MNFKTYHQLYLDIVRWSARLPRFDLIVGIPRSGMIAASMLSQIRNVPLGSLDWLLSTGGGYKGGARCPKLDPNGRVLVLDDSSGKGKVVRKVRSQLIDIGRHVAIGAVYVTKRSSAHCEHWFEVIEMPRVWEWNLFHHPRVMRHSCLDIDGVLCRDPSGRENDDGTAYEHFLLNAEPMIIPSVPVGALVTSRLERYRPQTELWLHEHCVQYGKLVMAQYDSKEERRADNRYAQNKANAYTDEYSLFVESEPKHARNIRRLTGKPVYCTKSGVMMG